MRRLTLRAPIHSRSPRKRQLEHEVEEDDMFAGLLKSYDFRIPYFARGLYGGRRMRRQSLHSMHPVPAGVVSSSSFQVIDRRIESLDELLETSKTQCENFS